MDRNFIIPLRLQSYKEHVDIECHLKLFPGEMLYLMVVPFQVINIQQQDQLKSQDLNIIFIMRFLEKSDDSGYQ